MMDFVFAARRYRGLSLQKEAHGTKMTSVPASAIDIAALTVSTLGLVGLLLAYFQFRLSRKANEITAEAARSSFVLEIHKWFREKSEEVTFFYRLDYDSSPTSFKFNAAEFPHSDDERQLDALLYKLVFVGSLLRRGVLDWKDVEWMTFIVSSILENAQVQEYLKWLQTPDQAPGHSEFVDAVFLCLELRGQNSEQARLLKEYVCNAKVRSVA